MLIAALLALVQDDIKRVLAYSTISQLAYMVAGLGVGAYTSGVFHIWTHAWFKALLFLGAGSVSHSVGSFNMSKMGGLKEHMPITYRTYIIGCLALAGIFPFAGFWSKDEILLGALEAGKSGSTVGWFVLIIGLVTAFLTACYVARMVALTFFGPPKYDTSEAHPHESPAAMTVPLVLLAVLSVAGGWVGLPGGANQFGDWVHFGKVHEAFNLGLAIFSTIIALAGLLIGWYIFGAKKVKVDVLRTPWAWVYKLLQNKYYVDEIYMNAVVRPIRDPIARFAYWTNQNLLDGVVNAAGIITRGLGNFAYNGIDQPIIDGAVNGVAFGAGAAGNSLKFWQSGNIQRYAAAMFVGIGLFVAGFLWLKV